MYDPRHIPLPSPLLPLQCSLLPPLPIYCPLLLSPLLPKLYLQFLCAHLLVFVRFLTPPFSCPAYIPSRLSFSRSCAHRSPRRGFSLVLVLARFCLLVARSLALSFLSVSFCSSLALSRFFLCREPRLLLSRGNRTGYSTLQRIPVCSRGMLISVPLDQGGWSS